MSCARVLNLLICLLFAANLVVAGGPPVLWRYLVCKEAWPVVVVSDNEDPCNSCPEPPPSKWAPERSPAAAVWAGVPEPSWNRNFPRGWARSPPAWSNWVPPPAPSTNCVLLLDDDPTPTNAGCFEEVNEVDGSLRIYCRLHCELTPFGGDIFFVKEDGENVACIKFVNYGVQLRKNDWYAWRSGSCLKQATAFRGRCVPQERWVPVPVPIPEPNGD